MTIYWASAYPCACGLPYWRSGFFNERFFIFSLLARLSVVIKIPLALFMWSAMGSLGIGPGPQWFHEDVAVGSDALFSVGSGGANFVYRVMTNADWWDLLPGRPSKLQRSFKPATTPVLSVIIIALAYLLIRCGQQFALKHPAPRHLAEALELGPTVSCRGGGEKGDDENQRSGGKSQDTGLRPRVEGTLKALKELACTANRVLTGLQPDRWVPAASLLLSIGFQELTAIAGFLDGDLEDQRRNAVRSFRHLQQDLWGQTDNPDTRNSSGRLLLRFRGMFDDAVHPPVWASFPSDRRRKNLLQDLIVMTNMTVAACETAILAMAASLGVRGARKYDPSIELLKRVRNTRQRHILSNPALSQYMEELRMGARWRALYTEGYARFLRKAGPKPLNENIAEFNLSVGGLSECLLQQMHRPPSSRPHAAPPCHLTIAHGPRPYQPVQQPPAALVLRGTQGFLPSIPFSGPPLQRNLAPAPIMSHGQVPFLPHKRGPLPSQGPLSVRPAPLSLSAHGSFLSCSPPQTHLEFPRGHLQSLAKALRAPTFPFQIGALPLSLPAIPLPFATPPYGRTHQRPSAGAPSFMPPYPFQQPAVACLPSSTQPGAQSLSGARPPSGDQGTSASLAPGSHRTPAIFYGHPLGTPADLGTSETDNQAPPVQAPPSALGGIHVDEEERRT